MRFFDFQEFDLAAVGGRVVGRDLLGEFEFHRVASRGLKINLKRMTVQIARRIGRTKVGVEGENGLDEVVDGLREG